MSFDEIKNIVKSNHDSNRFSLSRFIMPESTRHALREHFRTMAGSSFTEAAEMSAAKHGINFHMAILPGFAGMTVELDDTMPENTWKLVGPDGTVHAEGTVNEGNK